MASFFGRAIGKISDLVDSSAPDVPVPAKGGASADATACESVVEPQTLDALMQRAAHLRDVDWLPIERRQQKLVNLYLFVVDACLRRGSALWWQRALGSDQLGHLEQNIEALKE